MSAAWTPELRCALERLPQRRELSLATDERRLLHDVEGGCDVGELHEPICTDGLALALDLDRPERSRAPQRGR